VGFTSQWAKNLLLGQKTLIPYVMKSEKGQKEFLNSKQGKMLKEFFEDGSATGWAFLNDIKNIRKDVLRALDPSVYQQYKDSKLNVYKDLKIVFGRMTELSELTVRFSQYKTARERGMSRMQAATQAKEVSVNFDRKGLNNVSRLFGFWNASIQGVNKFTRLTKEHPAAMTSFMIGGALMGFLCTMLQPNDPDDERYWSEYDRMQNIIFGKVKIPISHFLRGFWALGVQAALAMQGEKSWQKSSIDGFQNLMSEFTPQQISALADFFEYNDEDRKLDFNYSQMIQGMMPTSLSPIVDVGLNIDFKGASISKVPYSKNLQETTPNTMRGQRNTNEISQAITDWLFESGGGTMWVDEDGEKHYAKTNRGVSSIYDWSPATIEHLTEGYLPGVGKFFNDSYKSIRNGINSAQKKEEFDWTNVPIVNRAIRPYREDKLFYSEYYRMKGIAGSIDNEYKALEKDDKERVSYNKKNNANIGKSKKWERYNEKGTKEYEELQIMKEINKVIGDKEKIDKKEVIDGKEFTVKKDINSVVKEHAVPEDVMKTKLSELIELRKRYFGR
jgi:hypothetical protein